MAPSKQSLKTPKDRVDLPAKKPSSPPCKQGGFDRSHPKGVATRDIIEVTFHDIGLNELFVTIPTKAKEGGTPAFNQSMIRLLDEASDEEKNNGNYCMSFKLKDPENVDIPLVVLSGSGRKYTTDVFINTTEGITTEGNDATLSDYFAATTNSCRLLNAKANAAVSAFKYGVPTNNNKGNKTPPGGTCLFDFLMPQDCVTIMKKWFDGVETKVAFMGNENRDTILRMIFGDVNEGFEMVSDIDEIVYNQL